MFATLRRNLLQSPAVAAAVNTLIKILVMTTNMNLTFNECLWWQQYRHAVATESGRSDNAQDTVLICNLNNGPSIAHAAPIVGVANAVFLHVL
jgi:hypothetical protein